MTVSEIINKLLGMAGNYGYYIDKTNRLHIVNFDEDPSTTVNLYVGEEGENIEDHSEYNVIECSVVNSLNDCYTRAIVTGKETWKEGSKELKPTNDIGTKWNGNPIPDDAADLRFTEIDFNGNRGSVSATYDPSTKVVTTRPLYKEYVKEYDRWGNKHTFIRTPEA